MEIRDTGPDHPTGLVERMGLISEECGETSQIVGKILRHGIKSDNKGRNEMTNRQMLEKEVGDILAAALICVAAGDINMGEVVTHAENKAGTVSEYLHNGLNKGFAEAARVMIEKRTFPWPTDE